MAAFSIKKTLDLVYATSAVKVESDCLKQSNTNSEASGEHQNVSMFVFKEDHFL